MRRTALLWACLVLALSACTPAPPVAPPVKTSAPAVDAARLTRFYEQKARWRVCSGHKGFQCADVSVPLDYTDPDGRTLLIAVNRLRTTGRRDGSLLVNPGGPGASGLDLAYAAKSLIGKRVRDRYDIVGFDPRGVGESNGIRCLDDDELDRFYLTDSTPDTRWEKTRLRTVSRRYAEQCHETSGWLLPHMGTENAARDLDVIRAVLGDHRLTYFGASYGTQLGQVYAGLFPGKTRRMVLDSVVDSGLWAGEVGKSQLLALDAEFDLFLDSCVRHGCPLGTTRKAAKARLWKLLGHADAEPMKGHGRSVRDTDVHAAAVLLAMEPRLWPTGRAAFAKAVKGDGTAIQVLAELERGRNPANGRYSSVIAANLAVRCLETSAEARAEAASDEHIAWMSDRSPLFAEINTQLACSFWKVPARPSQAVTPLASGPVLMLNNTKDPRTPLAWARKVAARFPGSVLVTNRASGHIVYGRGPCVDRAVENYLVDGRLPHRGLKCQDAGPYY